MVDKVTKLVLKSNDEQKKYLANLFGIGGGTIMYTAWQKLFELLQYTSLIKIGGCVVQIVFCCLVGASMLYWSYEIHGRRY